VSALYNLFTVFWLFCILARSKKEQNCVGSEALHSRPAQSQLVAQVWSMVGQRTHGLRMRIPPPLKTGIDYVVNWFQTPQ